MTRIVVTGASGFIGQHLVRRLLADGFDGERLMPVHEVARRMPVARSARLTGALR